MVALAEPEELVELEEEDQAEPKIVVEPEAQEVLVEQEEQAAA